MLWKCTNHLDDRALQYQVYTLHMVTSVNAFAFVATAIYPTVPVNIPTIASRK